MCLCLFFFFNDTATTEIYTLSLHDALPISISQTIGCTALMSGPTSDDLDVRSRKTELMPRESASARDQKRPRSEEHTSELQSRLHLVCRLLLEKKKNKIRTQNDAPHGVTKH